MKRVELFEFEDFAWLPDFIRRGITSLIVVLHRLMGTPKLIARLILKLKEKHSFTQITDLGSGAGGPMPEVIRVVNETVSEDPLKLVLTDLYPNETIIDAINSQNLPHLRYHDTSLDATDIGQAPQGLKTMIASFHHMNPTTAKKILQSAQDSRQPILIYEIAKNNIPFLLWLLLLPLSLLILVLMSAVLTLFARPLRLSQLCFTYLIPIIPIIYAWDGQASLMRTYTFADVEALLQDFKQEDYHWEIGDAQKEDGKNLGYYIMGYPK